MPSFQVVSEELTAASSLIARTDAQLATNGNAIGGTLGAAGGTPVAVVYEEFVFQIAGMLATVTESVGALGSALQQAAAAYALADQSATAGLTIGPGRR